VVRKGVVVVVVVMCDWYRDSKLALKKPLFLMPFAVAHPASGMGAQEGRENAAVTDAHPARGVGGEGGPGRCGSH